MHRQQACFAARGDRQQGCRLLKLLWPQLVVTVRSLTPDFSFLPEAQTNLSADEAKEAWKRFLRDMAQPYERMAGNALLTQEEAERRQARKDRKRPGGDEGAVAEAQQRPKMA